MGFFGVRIGAVGEGGFKHWFAGVFSAPIFEGAPSGCLSSVLRRDLPPSVPIATRLGWHRGWVGASLLGLC